MNRIITGRSQSSLRAGFLFAGMACLLFVAQPKANANLGSLSRLSDEPVSLGQALNATDLVWTISGAVPWLVATNETFDGVAAASSISAGEPGLTNFLQTSVVGPGRVSFMWRPLGLGTDLYSTTGGLSFHLNGIEKARCVNYTFPVPQPPFYSVAPIVAGWAIVNVNIPAGTNILSWCLSSSPSMEVRLDQVSFFPDLQAPQITIQPTSQTNQTGQTATFSAAGSAEGIFSWRRNGWIVAVSSNTLSSTLTLSNITAVNAGTYQVVLSNSLGSATSAPVQLVVEAISLSEALNTTNLVWTTTDATPWFGTMNLSHDGTSAAYFEGEGVSSSVTTTVTGPGVITFWAQTLASYSFDAGPLYGYFRDSAYFSINDVYSQSFSWGWQQHAVQIPSGSQKLSWNCYSDPLVHSRWWLIGKKTSAALDEVKWYPGESIPLFVLQPQSQQALDGQTVKLSAIAEGSAPVTYQWLLNGTNIPGATSTNLVLSNIQSNNAGTYSVIASNAFAKSFSTNAVLTVEPYMLNFFVKAIRVSTTSTNIQLDWPLIPNHDYRVLGSTNAVNWSPVSDWSPTNCFALPQPSSGTPYLFRVEMKP